ncbi:MAG: hypothetical protein JO247_11625 [Chloroflexi bacterium]|nr:hypothetical protein [Chloroflexota bacterium]
MSRVQDAGVDGVEVALQHLQPVGLLLVARTPSALSSRMLACRSSSSGGVARSPYTPPSAVQP